jgi:AcrR family transcriptional regulator
VPTSRAPILQAAHDALAESSDASLNSIAKRAAVGSGTLYQHFPTRGDLPPAVYWHDMTRLVDSVPEILPAALRTRFITLAP